MTLRTVFGARPASSIAAATVDVGDPHPVDGLVAETRRDVDALHRLAVLQVGLAGALDRKAPGGASRSPRRGCGARHRRRCVSTSRKRIDSCRAQRGDVEIYAIGLHVDLRLGVADHDFAVRVPAFSRRIEPPNGPVPRSLTSLLQQGNPANHHLCVCVQSPRSGEQWDGFAGAVSGEHVGEVFEERAALQAAGR